MSKSLVIEAAPNNVSMATTCEWCCHFNTKCIPTDKGAQCANCKVKHYRCLLIPAKEGSEGKGGSSGMHCSMTVAEGKAKAQEKKEVVKKVKAFDRVMLSMPWFLFF